MPGSLMKIILLNGDGGDQIPRTGEVDYRGGGMRGEMVMWDPRRS